MSEAKSRHANEWIERWGLSVPETNASWAADLALAGRAALAGGEAALAFYETDDLEVRDKGGVDGSSSNPVTLADHAANDAILEVLRTRTDDPVLSEESDPPGHRAADRLWIVDPLDGTKEFIARNGEFSMMVGLAVEGRARLGAVYQPAALRLYLGHVDFGAWCVSDPAAEAHAKPLQVDDSPGAVLRLIRSRSHPDPALQELESRLGPVEVVISGSVGIKCARIANGEADVYVHPVPFLKEWDTCAPEAVLRGAGGRVTDCAGGTLQYGKPDPCQPGGIFCGRPDTYERVSSLVRRLSEHLFDA